MVLYYINLVLCITHTIAYGFCLLTNLNIDCINHKSTTEYNTIAYGFSVFTTVTVILLA